MSICVTEYVIHRFSMQFFLSIPVFIPHKTNYVANLQKGRSFLGKITEELSQGNNVDFGDAFGSFSVKLRASHLTDNSPRTPKDDHYKVIFRDGKGMRQRLRLPVRKKNPFS